MPLWRITPCSSITTVHSLQCRNPSRSFPPPHLITCDRSSSLSWISAGSPSRASRTSAPPRAELYAQRRRGDPAVILILAYTYFCLAWNYVSTPCVPASGPCEREVPLSESVLTREQLDDAVSACGEFGADNRAGINRTLHRISCIRNRAGGIVRPRLACLDPHGLAHVAVSLAPPATQPVHSMHPASSQHSTQLR